MQVLGLRVLEDVGNTAADELRTLVLDTVVELLVHLTEGTDIHVEEIRLDARYLLDDLVGMLQ